MYRHFGTLLIFCESYPVLYSFATVMSCWDADPQNRPKFADLVQQLSDVLEQEAGYLDLRRSLSWRKPQMKEDSMTDTPALQSIKAEVNETFGEDVELEKIKNAVTEATNQMALIGEEEAVDM